MVSGGEAETKVGESPLVTVGYAIHASSGPRGRGLKTPEDGIAYQQVTPKVTDPRL